MVKRLLSSSTIALLIALGVPAAASAHVLKVDGHIGAVLHINPDDAPTTGRNTDYVMAFDDDTGKFSLPRCDCTVSVIENGKPITTEPLVISSSEVSEDHYTFIKPAVYDMRFTGTPKVLGTFQPFTLDYEVRVTDGPANTQPMPVALWIGMSMGIGLVLLAAYAQNSVSNEPTEEREEHEENTDQ